MSALDPKLLLHGYAAGIFPMAESRTSPDLFWVEPKERAIIPLDGFHLSRSLRKDLRSGRFSVTCDRDFGAVVSGCADRGETWINAEIERAVMALHGSGHAHSIEVWDGNGALAGGLYGVRLRRAFFGESMFSRARDASKVALASLVARLRVGGFTLLDCQFMTSHLESLGAVAISRDDYVRLLMSAVDGGGSVAVEAEFSALDRLLEASGSAGSPGAAGKVIAQLLGQTS